MKTLTGSINGVDLDQLGQTMEAIKADPSRGMTRWRVATEWNGDGPASTTRVTGWELAGEWKDQDYTIEIDEPRELLGRDAFANPQETLLAATNACVLATWVAACAANGITIESLGVEIEGEIDLRGFLAIDAGVKPGYESLRLTTRIRSDATAEQLEQIHAFVRRTSPNFDNMATPIRIESEVVAG